MFSNGVFPRKEMASNFQIFDNSEEGKKWAVYLKNLKPEDFSKYKI
jgi:hypothetical protein